ncbi:hypothetical protein [Priestia megaterium]|uniref:hypothetical protein n=1 Tax=Priestia megaterium TaxID=1404 RepID=UPI001A94BEA4|nr:hypothetical protein [Priestia megaterium]QSX24152.1 hypothetical protein J0P05_31485 [Priestia megaterium]
MPSVYFILTVLRTKYRNNIFWFITLVSAFYLMKLFHHFIFSENHYNVGNSLTMTSFLTQFFILIFLVLGAQLQKDFKRHSLFNLLDTSKCMVKGSVLLAIFYSISISTVATLIYSIQLLIRGYTISLYFLESYQYILVYWGLPIFISFMLGQLLCTRLNFKFTLPILFAVAFLIGPLNTFILPYSISSLLNIGQSDYNHFFNPQYGFHLEEDEIYKRIFLSTSLVLIFLLKNKLNPRNKKNILVFILFIFMCMQSIHGMLEPSYKLRMGAMQQNIFDEELAYYSGNHNNNKTLNHQKLKIKSQDISLNTEENVHINTLIKAENKGDTLNQFSFNLYHGFKIKSIKMNKKKVKFVRDKDLVKINKRLDKGTFFLKINYEVEKLSPLFYANNHAVHFPSYFPWLPQFNLNSSLINYESNFHRQVVLDSNEVNYKLSVRGIKKGFTNLEKQKEGTYVGTSADGVSYFSGDLIKRKINGYTVILPTTWELSLNSFNKFEDYIKRLTEFRNSIEKERISLPKKLFILPITQMNDSYFEENAWTFKDYAIFYYPVYTDQSEKGLVYQEYLTHSFLPSVFWKNENVNPNKFEDAMLFDVFVGYYFNKSHSVEDEYIKFVLAHYDEKNHIYSISTIQQVINIINSKNDEKIRAFFGEWSKLLKTEKINNESLEQIIKKF